MTSNSLHNTSQILIFHPKFLSFLLFIIGASKDLSSVSFFAKQQTSQFLFLKSQNDQLMNELFILKSENTKFYKITIFSSLFGILDDV